MANEVALGIDITVNFDISSLFGILLDQIPVEPDTVDGVADDPDGVADDADDPRLFRGRNGEDVEMQDDFEPAGMSLSVITAYLLCHVFR